MAMTAEWDARLYNGAGQRMRLPSGWVESVDFEIGENGGMLNGALKLLAPWEVLQLVGGERLDVWLWGALCYRGWVRLPTNEAAVPESKTLSLQGLMQTLRGYLVRRNFAYAAQTDTGQVFRDLVNFYAIQTGRLPSLQLDTTGVAPLNLTIETFDATGRDLAEALNDLVNVSPGSLIWGCDVDSLGRDRAYLRPRTQTVKYKYSVGDRISAFVYPVDTTQVVNSVFVTGGPQVYPNLAPNPSFERVVSPSETAGNLLLSPSFEDASAGVIPNWGIGPGLGNPTQDASFSRTGTNSVVLDNNPSAPEGVYQEVFLPALPTPVGWTVYARCPATEAWSLHAKLEVYDSGGTLLASQTPTITSVPNDELWHQVSGSWIVAATAGAVKIRLTLNTAAPDSGAHGLNIDDAALWFGSVLAESWQPGHSSNANFAALDWQNRDVPPFDGDIVVKAQANIIGGGGYTEIVTTPAARIRVQTRHTYKFGIYIAGSAVSPPIVAIGAYGYVGSTLKTPIIVGPHTTISSGLWHLLTYDIVTGVDVDGVDLFVRFYNNNPAWVDGAGVWENNLPIAWYPASDFVAHVSVSDYSGSVSSAAAASITAYGLREKEESNVNVIDQASLDAFAVGYFNAHAVPMVQARLDLFGPTAPLNLDGSVQVLNLPSEPPALFPSRVRYTVSENAIKISADLGNTRPDLALLLQQAARQGGLGTGRTGGSGGGGSSGGVGAPGGTGAPGAPGPAGPPGVAAALAPLAYNSSTQTVSLVDPLGDYVLHPFLLVGS